MDWIYSGHLSSFFIMTIFELFEIVPMLSPEKEAVRKQFLNLTRRYHPDKASQNGIDDFQAIQMTAEVNKAYTLLQDEYKLLGYILKDYKGYQSLESEKLDGEFLMEMMDLNEEIDSKLEDSNEHPSLIELVNSRINLLNNSILHINNKIHLKDLSDSDWQILKEFYLKMKYYLRIMEKINTFAPL